VVVGSPGSDSRQTVDSPGTGDLTRKSRFAESQIVAILKEGEAGVALSELARKHGISRAT